MNVKGEIQGDFSFILSIEDREQLEDAWNAIHDPAIVEKKMNKNLTINDFALALIKPDVHSGGSIYTFFWLATLASQDWDAFLINCFQEKLSFYSNLTKDCILNSRLAFEQRQVKKVLNASEYK